MSKSKRAVAAAVAAVVLAGCAIALAVAGRSGPTPTSGSGVPTVKLPAGVHYYATDPPQRLFGTRYVRVYDPTLRYRVWVSLGTAEDHGWYTGSGDYYLWAFILALAAVGVFAYGAFAARKS